MAFAAGGIIRAADIDDAIKCGVAPVSFTDAASYTQTVTFAKAFAGIPNVHLNVNSGAGSTARWIPRAINLTAGGFTIFLFPTVSGTTGTWNAIPVAWTAIYRP